ncbi:uncharacterized protein LOC114375323 [Glycine soja]|uniref:uncharacterized protein LOC114375323 n=1 Tax=Glycine soja TaxID=3848 RepID=UPI001039086A|nr:uncharacterized protein LOC114375323 [Glycine soja]
METAQFINDKGIHKIQKKLNEVEDLASNRSLSDDEIKSKRELQQQLWEASTAYESLLRQKSRAKWLKEGDNNSTYFHKVINFRRHYNGLQGFLIQGEWIQNPNDVKKEAEQREFLAVPFLDLEIKEAVWSCDGHKCPGPDGFNFKFIKEFWEMMKTDFRRFVDEFHVHGSFPRGSNASFIALIPKTKHPQSFDDYRPISLIGSCLHSASISILINDNPSKEFLPTRGLRQGDTLAPLLFNIVGEGITGMMRQVVHKNLYRSFLVGKKKEPINILQYADDTVFVGEAVWENIHVIKALLRGYELASGLNINFAKSQFGIIGGGVNWSLEAANILPCRQLEYPFLYLGLPIGANPSSQFVWEPLISKFKSKLAKWAQRDISMAGKITLINSVGSGENIKFWTDNWLGEQHTLQQKYNQLFLISRQQKDHISQMGHSNHNSWRWDMRWRRNLFDHESHLAVQFMEEISFVPIQR